MPTNLPAEAQAAWNRYLEAKTLEEKIRALEEFVALVPKHKGTEKLLMNVKKTLTKLKLELSKKREIRRGTSIHPAFSIPKEEDAQITLLGLPGAGKTALFWYLTGKEVQWGKPTLLPDVGAWKHKGAVFQVIDLPPVFSDDIDDTPNGRQILSLIRNCDLVFLIIDSTQDIDWQFKTLMRLLKDNRIVIDREPPPIRFRKTSRGGIQIYGAYLTPFSSEELRRLILSMGISNCVLEILDHVDEEDILNALDSGTIYKRAIIVLTKIDLYEDSSEIKKMIESISPLKVVPISALNKSGKDTLGDLVLSELNLIRIWTRKNGIVSQRAIVLRKGSTVKDVAEKIHSDFVKKFKFAIVERPKAKINKLRVGLNFKVEDGDVITIYVQE